MYEFSGRVALRLCFLFAMAPKAPALPKKSWNHIQPVPGGDASKSITHELDEFRLANAAVSKSELLLKYVEGLSPEINNSQLLQAQLVYLFFAGSDCPIKYDTGKDYWHVYDAYWHTEGNTMSKATLYFQTDLLTTMRQVVRIALADNVFPPVGEQGKEHLRMVFLNKMVQSLECKDSIDKIVRECTIFFSNEQVYDQQPLIFQLHNCVLDLRTNTFRKGNPSDLTSRRSPIIVPDAWLRDPSLIDIQSEENRHRAWDILWSIFCRDGDQHPLDQADILGDQDENNFLYFMRLQARMLEGKPLAKCVLLHSPRGRNSKGLIEKILQSVWGEYFVPVKASVFLCR